MAQHSSPESSHGSTTRRVPNPPQNELNNFAEWESLLFSDLESAHDGDALQRLDHLSSRFGPSNERVMALRGLYEEAIAENRTTLEGQLQKYDSLLSENPVNLPILKRRIALLRTLSKPAEAITSLVQLLDAVPTDAEAWCELADLYQSQGMSSQAIFSLEEALLIVPHAWNVHARLGEVLYIYACSLTSEAMYRVLKRSIQYFCRSIELCNDYLRGLYGLALATSPSISQKHPETVQADEFYSKDTLQQLHNFARRRLEAIIKSQQTSETHLPECKQGELSAVKELLGRLLPSN